MKKQVRKVDQAKVRQRKHIAFRMNFLFFSIFHPVFIAHFPSWLFANCQRRRLCHGYWKEQKKSLSIQVCLEAGYLTGQGRSLSIMNRKMQSHIRKTTSTTSKEMLEIAEKLATLIEQDTKRVTIGDKRDFWILKNSEEAVEKVSKKEIEEIENDSDAFEQRCRA